MLIKSKIKRKNGTTVKLEDKVYHFKPNKIDDHVCEVNKAAHANHLLSIKEGFEQYSKAEPEKDDSTDSTDNADDLAAKEAADRDKTLKLEQEEKAELAAKQAAEASGEPEPLTEEEIAKTLADLETDEGDEDQPEGTDEWYRDQYVELMGKKPHHNTKIETIREDVDKILNPSN